MASVTVPRTSILTAEEIRSRIGFTRAQWTRCVESGYAVQLLPDFYSAFTGYLVARLDIAFERPAFVVDGVPYLSTASVSQTLGIGEFLIANLRARGKLSAGTRVGRRSVFAKEDLLDLIRTTAFDRRSALTGAFIRWLRQQDRSFTMSDE